ncbi:mCG59583, partial [Mus musculus]
DAGGGTASGPIQRALDARHRSQKALLMGLVTHLAVYAHVDTQHLVPTRCPLQASSKYSPGLYLRGVKKDLYLPRCPHPHHKITSHCRSSPPPPADWLAPTRAHLLCMCKHCQIV